MRLVNMISPAAALALLILVGTSAVFSVANAAQCRSVRGALEEIVVPPPTCDSPVGLCTVARLFGQFKGQANFTATSITPSFDTPATGVVFVTGDTIIDNAQLEGKVGTLSIKNAAAFRTVGGGDLTDTQVIVGGTGAFTGASGSVRVTGTVVNGSGTSTYEGTICIP